VILNDSVQCL